MAPRLQQRQLVPLAVDVDQVPPEVAQHALGHGATVHAGAAAAAGAHLAANDELARRLFGVVEQAQRAELVLQGPQGGGLKLEHPLDDGALGAGAHQFGRRAGTQEQAHRVDDDRLAGARLPRQHVEPGAKLQS